MPPNVRLRKYERKRHPKLPSAQPDAALRTKVCSAPEQPGCYLFSDKAGNIIYVGKAKNLARRVRSYFTKAAAEDERTAELVTRIADLQLLQTASELDALLLEYKLIKQHKPWYNSQMKPDKQRPYLRLSADVPYPSLSVAEQPADDGAEYFDYFADEYDINRTLAFFCIVWGLPRCGRVSFAKRKSPCIYHRLDGCQSPCSGLADAEAYMRSIEAARQLLTGQPCPLLDELRLEMHRAADELEFERAENTRLLLEGLQQLHERSQKRYHLPDTGTVLVLIRPYREKSLSAFLVVDKQVVRRYDFPAGAAEAAAGAEAAEAGAPLTQIDITEDWLAACLVEVGAKKRFIDLLEVPTTQEIAAIADSWI